MLRRRPFFVVFELTLEGWIGFWKARSGKADFDSRAVFIKFLGECNPESGMNWGGDAAPPYQNWQPPDADRTSQAAVYIHEFLINTWSRPGGTDLEGQKVRRRAVPGGSGAVVAHPATPYQNWSLPAAERTMQIHLHALDRTPKRFPPGSAPLLPLLRLNKNLLPPG